ncbi:MAG: hypothetical protein QXM48_04190 [Sulfolobales archaeon]
MRLCKSLFADGSRGPATPGAVGGENWVDRLSELMSRKPKQPS